ncbi:MAG TPA: FtsX-like permease family protein [Bryobacteraceae bacterium]
MRKLWRRLYFLLHRQRMERELAEEMEAHRELMPTERRTQFGNATWLREESSETWLWTWLERLWQDLSYAARVLWRAPAFTLGATAVLALGVGVNLAELQIFDGLIFHRLNFRDANSVLQFSRVSKQRQSRGFPPAAVEFYRSRNRSFAWLIGEEYLDAVLEGDANVRALLVPGDYFRNIGIGPAEGRLLEPSDARPDAAPIAVLSYSYWKAHRGADPSVVGRVMRLNNLPVQIVGIAPYDFDGIDFGSRTDVWLPVTLSPQLVGGGTPPEQDFSQPRDVLLGRLKPGVSQAAGEADLTVLTQELARQERAFDSDERVHSEFVQTSMFYRASPIVAIFLIMVLLVLLSACANLGNMLLARGLAREREIQIRAAIGASRMRVVRQLMTENAVLALLGMAAGLAFGHISARLLLDALNAPPSIHVSLSGPILIAALALTVLAALAFGLPSALHTVRPNPHKARLRQTLIGVQVAVSCLLLIASGVLSHNGIAAAYVDLAFDYQNMIAVNPRFYYDREAATGIRNLTNVERQRLDALSARLSALPGVEGVTYAGNVPLAAPSFPDTLPGLPPIFHDFVAPSYFEVMKLPMMLGRTFLPGEQDVAIVSESAAREIWPNQSPMGQKLNLAGAERAVVGVVKDSGANLIWDTNSVEAYLPAQGPASLILHTRTDPAPLLRLIPAAAGELHETVGVQLLRTLRENTLQGEGRVIAIFGSVGALATVLAAAGMFALVSFAVAQRKRELGIRIAMGATPRHIVGVLLAQNAKPTVIGIVVGVVLAAVVSRLVRGFLFFLIHDTVDVRGFAGGIAAFVLVAILATLSPVRRALRIDPAATLREE